MIILPGNDKVCFLSDRTEKEDNFFIYEQGSLEKQPGYYIYYEKNEKMKKYVKSINNGKSSIDSAQQTKSEAKKEDRQINNIKLNEPENKRQSNQKRNKAPVPAIDSAKSFRDIAKEERQDTVIRQGKMAYGVSGILIIALLLSTVVMLNNYGELKNIKQTLSNFNMKQEAQAVNQILNSETTPETTRKEKNDNGESQVSENKETVISETKNDEKTDTTETVVNSSYSGKSHVVKAGQTLYDISMKYYGTSKMVDEIKEYNDIDDDYTIVEGQKILLP